MISFKEVQDKLLDTYMSLLEKPTIRELSKDSGIQNTRLFRIMNGSEMKLSEYLIIKNRVASLSNKTVNLLEDASNCENILSTHGIDQLSTYMRRKIKLSNIVNNKIAA
jgi:hypothetical protein